MSHLLEDRSPSPVAFSKLCLLRSPVRLGISAAFHGRLPSKVPASVPVYLRQRAFDVHEVLILAHDFIAILDQKASRGVGFIRVV